MRTREHWPGPVVEEESGIRDSYDKPLTSGHRQLLRKEHRNDKSLHYMALPHKNKNVPGVPWLDQYPECVNGVCTAYAANNAAGYPVTKAGQKKYMQSDLKNRAGIQEKMANKHVVRTVDQRSFTRPTDPKTAAKRWEELEAEGKSIAEWGKKNTSQKTITKAGGFTTNKAGFWAAMEDRGIKQKPTTVIRNTGSYVVIGKIPKKYVGFRRQVYDDAGNPTGKTKYINPGGVDQSGGGHAIAIRDGYIYDNNVSAPIPYTRRNLYKHLQRDDYLEIRKMDYSGSKPESKKRKWDEDEKEGYAELARTKAEVVHHVPTTDHVHRKPRKFPKLK